MQNAVDLGTVLDPSEWVEYIRVAESLETVIHKYGATQQVPDYTCWMEYENEGNNIGSIAFTRHTSKHPVLSQFTKQAANVLKDVFPKHIPVLEERIHLLRTQGNIVTHRDESGRMSCINIGLLNSSVAVTKFSLDGIYENFDNSYETLNVLDGHAYLINTNQWHSVTSAPGLYRYLITYGFGANFATLKQVFKSK